MPPKTYMVVDPRHDHSIRIPRPDLSVKLGTPNACNQCHQDKDAKWAEKQVKTWYGNSGAKGFQRYAQVFSAARLDGASADSALASLIRDKSTPNIARTTALAEIGPYLSQTTVDVLPLSLADEDPGVRAAAVGALEQTPLNMRVSFAFRMLDDPVRAVRIEAARVLMTVPAGELSPQQWTLLNTAMQEYVAAQMANAERPEAQTNLGNFYAAQGAVDKALKAYQTSIALSPMYVPGYVNLADLYRAQGDEAQAEKVLRQAISTNPNLAVPHHVLGLSLVRQKRMDEALSELALAAKLDPNNVRYTYIYAVALQSTGKAQQAIKILETVYYQHPSNRDVLSALAAFHRDAGNETAAQDYAEKLRSLSP